MNSWYGLMNEIRSVKSGVLPFSGATVSIFLYALFNRVSLHVVVLGQVQYKLQCSKIAYT